VIGLDFDLTQTEACSQNAKLGSRGGWARNRDFGGPTMRASQWITGASSLTLICVASFAQIAGAQGPQVPIPQTASKVPKPALGPMTPAYVRAVGRMAYVWGWPLVYVYNQRNELTKVPESLLLDNAVPVAPMNQLTMLHDYANPAADITIFQTSRGKRVN
jgi:hypothetical protein